MPVGVLTAKLYRVPPLPVSYAAMAEIGKKLELSDFSRQTIDDDVAILNVAHRDQRRFRQRLFPQRSGPDSTSPGSATASDDLFFPPLYPRIGADRNPGPAPPSCYPAA